jgi:hypothetical protein
MPKQPLVILFLLVLSSPTRDPSQHVFVINYGLILGYLTSRTNKFHSQKESIHSKYWHQTPMRLIGRTKDFQPIECL